MFITLTLCSTFNLTAEISVDLTMPDFKDDISSQLEAMLEENILAAGDDVETTINNLLDKPGLTGAFSSAAASGASIPLQGNIFSPDGTISFGGYGSFYSYTLDIEELMDDLEDVDEEDDPEVGANIQLIQTGVRLPAEFLPQGFQTGLSAAFADLSNSDFFYQNLTIQGSLAYTPFRKIPLNRSFRWTPLSAQFAATYSGSEIGASLETGTITQEFDYEIDSSGFLPDETITVELDPTVDLSLETQVYVLTADLATGFSLHDFFHFYLGGGVNVPWGKTDIAASTEDEFSISSNIIDSILEVDEEGNYSTGSIVISGSVEGSSPVQFIPYAYGGFRLDISRIYLNIPIQYTYPDGLASGLFLGVYL